MEAIISSAKAVSPAMHTLHRFMYVFLVSWINSACPFQYHSGCALESDVFRWILLRMRDPDTSKRLTASGSSLISIFLQFCTFFVLLLFCDFFDAQNIDSKLVFVQFCCPVALALGLPTYAICEEKHAQKCNPKSNPKNSTQTLGLPMHYWLRWSMGFEKY